MQWRLWQLTSGTLTDFPSQSCCGPSNLQHRQKVQKVAHADAVSSHYSMDLLTQNCVMPFVRQYCNVMLQCNVVCNVACNVACNVVCKLLCNMACSVLGKVVCLEIHHQQMLVAGEQFTFCDLVSHTCTMPCSVPVPRICPSGWSATLLYADSMVSLVSCTTGHPVNADFAADTTQSQCGFWWKHLQYNIIIPIIIQYNTCDDAYKTILYNEIK